jgi:hypothetical protein
MHGGIDIGDYSAEVVSHDIDGLMPSWSSNCLKSSTIVCASYPRVGFSLTIATEIGRYDRGRFGERRHVSKPTARRQR